MLKEIYTAAMGMIPQQTRLEVAANNLANSQTAGYKRQGVFERNLIDARNIFYNTVGDAEQQDAPVGAYIDYSNGSFESTGNVLDLAIENDKSFFVTEDNDGKRFLTRSGHFLLSSDGSIVTTDGKKLLGSAGAITVKDQLLLDPDNIEDTKNIEIKITETGEVFANDTPIDQLLVARVENPETLEHISNATFIARQNTSVEFVPQDEIQVRQGWLENSNVNIIKEMVSMIELQRMFEAGTKVIQTNDSTLDTSIKMGRYY